MLILVLEIKVIYLLMLYLVSDETCIYQNISCNLNHSVIGRIIYSTEQLYSASSVIRTPLDKLPKKVWISEKFG